MQLRKGTAWLALVLSLATAGVAFAQGSQTGTITGTVEQNDGTALPGATVTVTSPALQGSRTAITGANGDYSIRLLPPGQYKVVFSLEGLKPTEMNVTVPLGGTARADAKMEMATAEETIVVTGEAPSPLQTTVIATNLEAETIDELPIGRNPVAVAQLAPGLTDNTPVAGQVTINGAMAYDNAILINGVNVQDPIFGQTNNLFIEEAIEETQVLTSGISAEYGGFTGGVINSITKSGSNEFKGSLRADATNLSWRDETPFERSNGVEHESNLTELISATLGGPIVHDRLWFFVAGQTNNPTSAVVRDTSTPFTGQPYQTLTKNNRYEVKLTGSITPSHSLQASYINNDRSDVNNRQLNPIETASLNKSAEFPNDGWQASYTGIFTGSLYGELRYSEKAFQFKGLGGTGSDIINDSPYYAYGYITGISGLWNAPYFDATDPEDRNNKDWTASLSYFLSTESAGSHDMKVGYDDFTVTRTGGNSQTPTNYVWVTDPAATAGGDPIFDAQGRLIPVFEPGLSQLWIYIATRGAALDIETKSAFFNDRWNLNKNLSFNLGVRYENTTSSATGGVNALDTTAFTPRLGVSWDVKGDGMFKVDATYAQYAGRYNPSIFGRNSPVGNPLGQYYTYVGPAGEGRDCAYCYDLDNYHLDAVAAPAANIFFDNNIKAPISTEYTASFGMQLPKGGFAKLTYVDRKTTDFVEDFIDLSHPPVQIGENLVDAITYRNTSHLERKYQGIQISAEYRPTDNWTIDGNWTHQLKNDGTYEGEAGQSVGGSAYGNRPEIFPEDRTVPNGHLSNYQADKVRLWTNYNLGLGKAGELGIGLLGNYDSAQTFSYAGSCRTSLLTTHNPGYQTVPTSFTCYFGDRGAGKYNDFYTFDLALNYSIPVWKSLSPWVKVDVRNILNFDDPVYFRTNISPNNAGPRDANGVPTTYTRSSVFGVSNSNADYVIPREYRISAGIRF